MAIKICAPHWHGAESWGDLHFANALAAELRRRGHTTEIQVLEEWDDPDEADVVLHLRGLDAYVPRRRPGTLNLLWVISHPERVTAAECDRYDVAWSASPRHARTLSRTTRRPVRVLQQATDPSVCFPDPDPGHARELVFVGNSRGVFRPILRDLLPTDRDLAIWGKDWEAFADPRHLAGDYLRNDEVRRAYSSAQLVLNDHWDDMREWGIVSNRVFDVLACGGALISDAMPELDELLPGAIATYETRAELIRHVEWLLSDQSARVMLGERGRAAVLANHTFAQRADVLLRAVAERLPALAVA